MPRVSAAFFATGVLCIFAGGAIGIFMARTGHTDLVALHVHLNLVGWATMALCGTFYALTEKTMIVRLAWINYVVFLAALLLTFPAFATILIRGGSHTLEMILQAGNGMTALGMVIFAFSVFRELFRRRA